MDTRKPKLADIGANDRLPLVECASAHLSSLHGDENPHVLFYTDSRDYCGARVGLSPVGAIELAETRLLISEIRVDYDLCLAAWLAFGFRLLV